MLLDEDVEHRPEQSDQILMVERRRPGEDHRPVHPLRRRVLVRPRQELLVGHPRRLRRFEEDVEQAPAQPGLRRRRLARSADPLRERHYCPTPPSSVRGYLWY